MLDVAITNASRAKLQFIWSKGFVSRFRMRYCMSIYQFSNFHGFIKIINLLRKITKTIKLYFPVPLMQFKIQGCIVPHFNP